MVPLVYPGTIEVRMFLDEVGRTSVGSFYEIWMNETQYAEGAAKMVWTDIASGRPIPLPGGILALLAERSAGS